MTRVLATLVLVLTAGSAWAGPWQGFTALTLSPDGRWFATGGRDGEVIWFETSSGEVRARCPGAGSTVVDLVFASDNSSVAAAMLDGSTLLCDPTRIATGVVPAGAPQEGRLTGAVERWIAAAPLASGVTVSGGGLLARGAADGTIVVGRLGQPETISWQAHSAVVTGLALSADGSVLISAAYDGTLSLWDPLTGKLRGRL